ncbi:hypothetical protein GCM10011273_23150 [Asticcacaulis endophyticus]|uniref:Uncharacterized protein n=1 Tax=Asticcacaulis endophyticus TaxID=1395890 RepID=A0A918UVQ0_9CAUL|nr:hypothetical protein GCM10011273_23150 [Asticcacaulis endophyticus]
MLADLIIKPAFHGHEIEQGCDHDGGGDTDKHCAQDATFERRQNFGHAESLIIKRFTYAATIGRSGNYRVNQKDLTGLQSLER